MKTFLGLIGWCLVVYGPELCRDPYTRFGSWCLQSSGDWTYRDQRIAYESGAEAFKRGRNTRASNPYTDPYLADFWFDGWDDEATQMSMQEYHL